MSDIDLRHIGRFVLLILFQGLILIEAALFDGLAIPFVYVFILLKLPIDINRIFLLILCFLTGVTMDLFYNTFGLHAAACVLMGFVRPGILNLIRPRDGYDTGQDISISSFGFNWFFTFSFSLIFIHHLYLFLLEFFSFSQFPYTLLKVLLSSIYTFILVFLIHLIFSRKS
ncbi:MAG: hypothetical protein AAF487_00455 [Bacteroidota bacterium]